MEANERFLVDTNIWLERLLDQEKSDVVQRFLKKVPLSFMYVSDFSMHSIGVILTRLNKLSIYEKFTEDLFLNGQIKQLSLEPDDVSKLILNIKKNNLDFDDAYQVTVSEKFNLTVITFDKDFNVKNIRSKSPEKIIHSK